MNIYIIGTGVMGSAIAKALAKKGQKVFVYNRTYAKALRLAKQKNITADKDFQNLNKADFIILAVKPQDMPLLAQQIQNRVRPSIIVVSIAAGIKLANLAKMFKHKKLVRIIPTLSFTVGQGVAFWQSSKALSMKEKRRVSRLFSTFTQNFEVKNEDLIDIGGIIYGSAKAYFFLLAQALQQTSVKLGINPSLSRVIVEKTFLAASRLQTNQDYDFLIRKVATKKGITEASLKVFKQKNFSKIVELAVKAGFNRAKELNRG